MQVLGGENNEHAKPLVEALKAARAKSRVPPVSERLTSCRNFLERARKRVTRAEDLIAKAVEKKTAFMQEVEEAEERLKQLEAEASKPTPPDGVAAENRGVRERDALRGIPIQGVWCADGPPSVDAIPPMPSSDLHELQGWLSAPNRELRNASEFGDTTTIAKLGNGFFRRNRVIGRRVQIDFDVGSDRPGRSEETLRCCWIRCTAPISGGQSCLRSARYGLRGVRPPQSSRPHFSEDGVENVLSSLELELTMLESDEEPLVRPVSVRGPQDSQHSTTNSACFTQGSGGSREAPTFRGFISVRSVNSDRLYACSPSGDCS